jgi:hypothetical protein
MVSANLGDASVTDRRRSTASQATPMQHMSNPSPSPRNEFIKEWLSDSDFGNTNNEPSTDPVEAAPLEVRKMIGGVEHGRDCR